MNTTLQFLGATIDTSGWSTAPYIPRQHERSLGTPSAPPVTGCGPDSDDSQEDQEALSTS